MRTVLVVFLLSGCRGDSPEDPHRLAVIASLAENVGLVQYKNFESQSEQLAAVAKAACESMTDESLSGVRDAWWTARGGLKTAEIIQFGPVVEYPDRLGPKLDDWPVNEDAVDELLEGDSDLSLADFQRMGTATRGLPVVEYLLWGAGEDSVSALQNNSRRCLAVVGSTADVAASGARLREVWQNDWVARLSLPESADDDAYDMAQDVIDEWVNRMAFTVENIRAEKLGKPVGDSAGGEPQPDTIESRYSGRSLMDARDALIGVAQVWSGDVETSHLGIQDLVSNSALIERVDLVLSVAQERLSDIPETLEQTVLIEPEIIARAQEALLELQVSIQVDLAQELGVTLAFNDNDGD